MKVQIQKILGTSKLSYINFVDEQFSDWCTPIANSFLIPHRALVTNTQLYNWFINNWETRVVYPFLTANSTYITAGVVAPRDYQILFNDEIEKDSGIYHIYPSVIIKQIKQQHYAKINAD